MFGQLGLNRPPGGGLTLRDAAISGSLAGRLNRLAVDTETKRDKAAASNTDGKTPGDSTRNSGGKKAKLEKTATTDGENGMTLEERQKADNQNFMDQMRSIDVVTKEEARQERKVVTSGDVASITDDMIVQAMGNQNRLCLLNGTTARGLYSAGNHDTLLGGNGSNRLNDNYRASNRAVKVDTPDGGEWVIPLAPINKMDL
eukprot:3937445-Prymnesium_polylepis.1